MAVAKAVELIGTGPSIEQAVDEALDRAGLTLEGITGFEVAHIAGELTDAGRVYRVRLTVWFTLLERMHG
jgi:flavin-binding protein dodecin